MKIQFALAILLAITASAVAQQTVASFDWKAMRQTGQASHSGAVVTSDGQSILQISSTDAGLQTRLLQITNPPISKKFYAITGRIKYENVSGDGFLEMWNYFPPLKPGMPEGQYFSRTLGQSGEMGKIHGTSDWRDFTLPFDSTGASGRPTRLQINLVLPGKGNVSITSLKLMQYEGGYTASTSATPGWWTPRVTVWIGAIGGPLVASLGALIGWLASRGRARGFVVAGMRGMAAAGVLCTAAGFFALAARQPYAVCFPLFLFGMVLVISLFQIPTVQRRYDEIELRRMNSIDAMAS